MIERDSDLEGYDKHKVYSQRGTLLALMSKKDLEEMEDVNISLMDWRTKASRRELHSTFAAESQSASESHGLALYFRAYWCDVLLGHADWIDVTQYGGEHLPII